MALGCYSCTAGSIYADLCFRQGCLQQQSVGDHTDIRADPDQPDLGIASFLCQVRQLCASKGRLLQDHAVPGLILKLRDDLPSLRTLDTVGNRQVSPFLSLQIVSPVSIHGKNQVCSFFPGFPYLFRHISHDLNRFLCAQGSGHKIVLHIHHYKQFFHSASSPFSLNLHRSFSSSLPSFSLKKASMRFQISSWKKWTSA